MRKLAALAAGATALLGLGSLSGAAAERASEQPSVGTASGEFANAFVALAFAPVSGDELWAANGGVIELSLDGGLHWRNITPPNLVGDDPGVRLAGFDANGPDNLWFAATGAGDAAPGGLRGFAIEHSGNGGRTWSWTGIPSCNGCSTMSISFVSPRQGWALGINSNLYETTNGGTTWSLIAKTALAIGAFPDAIDFATPTVGWLAASPSLYRSEDGGRRWETILLPPDSESGTRPSRLGAPHFFTPSTGEVPAILSNGQVVVYVTADGGKRWAFEPTPVSVAVNNPQWWVLPTVRVASRDVWSFWSGLLLYVTSNAGRTWNRVPPPPVYADSQPDWGFAMATATFGWIDASAARCPGGHRVGNCGVPILLRTTDAGRHWKTVDAPA